MKRLGKVNACAFLLIFLFLWPAVGLAADRPGPDPEAVKEVLAGQRSEANAAWWGFDPEDSTEYLQAAIDSGSARVIVPNMGQDWIVRPIFLRSNLELVLEEGTVVTAKKGEYHGKRDSVFTAQNVENVTIRGYGATIRMHKDDYASPPYEKAEWRMGINIRGGRNVEILGVTIRDTGGDGIYLGRGTWPIHNENIVIRDVIADNNYRQGISVITVRNLLIENSVFKNTGGTAPMAGIDFEPNQRDEILQDIVVRNSVFENNQGPGIVLALANLDRWANVSFLFENVLVRGGSVGFSVTARHPDNHAAGKITVRNCLIEGSVRQGIGLRNLDGDTLKIRFEDCIVHNVATSSAVPIYLEAGTKMGGVTFENVVVTDNKERPVLHGTVSRLVDDEAFFGITGQLEVVNPYGARIAWAGRTKDVTLQAVEQESTEIFYDRIVSLAEYRLPPVDVRPEMPPPPSEVIYVSENLLENPGFENTSADIPRLWAVRGRGTGAVDGWQSGAVVGSSEAARSGDVGVKMRSENDAYYWIQQSAPVEGGKTYELSAWVKLTGPCRKVALKVEFYAGSHVGEDRREWEWLDSYGEWINIKMQVEAPPQAQRGLVFLRLYGPGEVCYDDASLRVIEFKD
ncbi:MAG: right-handed parallel beta-helix repeat-containing protein [Limnochordia bacterium]|jgi:hypothetical protein